ncbi:MAG: filamentous hemagglutinin N-terminal domain-containing protein, partial [Nitrospirae bacterium]|nr:filamentous hemagglutinin N-terminal domain-containing protein [Nitrospirota bacterium]
MSSLGRLQCSVFFVVLLGVILTSLFLQLPRVEANPTGGQVVGGSADIVSTSSTRLDIIQHSDRAIIDWTGFSINQNEHTHFQQPSSQAIALNRVTGGNPSLIFGQLSATGRLVLVNPNGILFGPGSHVDVAGLVATTSDIHNSDFMNGRLDFFLPSPTNAGVVNQGDITVQEGGLVAFVAPWVENSGTIQARLGRVSLVSGNTYTLDLYGDQLIQLAVDDAVVGELVDLNGHTPLTLVRNSGKIVAEGGIVHLSVSSAQTALDKVLNMDGIIEAQSVEERNGVIVLHGGDYGIVEVAGLLDASGRDSGETGGEVLILGERVGLFASLSEEPTKIDVSGDSGGGTVLVGGNFQGKGPETNAKATVVAADVEIHADAVTEGDGGTVIVWADETTKFYGSISAQGGSQSGNGGFVETSGKEYLEVIGGQVDASATNGVAGEWLLDPRDVDIRNLASSNGTFDSGSPNIFTPSGDSAVADRNTIQASLNGGTNVTITTGATGVQNGDITVTDSITTSTGSPATLTLSAARNIVVNELISTTGSALDVSLTATAGSVTFGGGNAGITTKNGDVTVVAGTTVDLKDVDAGNGDLTVTANGGDITDSGTLTIGGNATLFASGGDIVLNEVANNFGTVTITGADNVTLVDTSGIILGAFTVNAALNVTAGGNISDSGALAVTGTTTLAAGASNITLNSAGNNFTGAVSVTNANNVTLVDVNAIDLSTSTVSGFLNVTAGGVISDSGNVSVTGLTTLAAGAGNNITLDRA